MTTQADCHRLANHLEDLAKLLRTGGPQLLTAADRYAAGIKAAAANPGSRPTGPNDLGERLMPPGDPDTPRSPDDPPFPTGLRPVDAYGRAAARIPNAVRVLQRVVPTMVADLTLSQTAVAVKREEANNLADINRRNGECETCYEAGRPDSYQDGTEGRKLEAVTIDRITMNRDADVTHEQLDLCHRCAVSCRGSRASARSAGTDWSVDEWATQRVDYLRTTVTASAGAA